MTEALRIEGLWKSFGELEVLRGLDLVMDEHEIVCVIGASGSGKSTLLRCINLTEPIDAGRIVLDPWDPAMLQPSSIDVRLDRFFRVFENHKYPHIDPAADQSDLTREVEPEGEEPFILHPGEFALGSTYEVVTLPDDIASRVEGKSSLGRLGLLTHATAGFVDPGFSGHVTLELANVDLTEEFANMITTQRSFQASSRLVTVSDQVLEEIVNLKR